MAVTLASLQTEAQLLFNESTSTTNGIFTSTFVLAAYNMFCDEWEDEMELRGSPTTYVVPASTTAIAFSSLGTSILQLQRLEVLDSSTGDVTAEILPRPKGSDSGYFIFNSSLYLNSDDGFSAATTVRSWFTRQAVRATTTSANADVHSGNERAVLIPYLLWAGYTRAKKPVTAEGFRRQFDYNFKRMMQKIHRQANPEHEAFEVRDSYTPLSG